MKQLNLCLHCGGYKTDLDTIANVPTPEHDRVWYPIPHIEVHNCVTRSIADIGMRIVGEQHALAREGQRYFALYQVANGDNSDEFGFVLGTRNSHDKSFKAGVAVGDGVFACDNLCFSAEIVMARVHTRFIMRDLPVLFNRAVGQLAERWHQMGERISTYKEYQMDDRDAHDFLIRSVDAGAMAGNMLPDVLKEWRFPSHDEFAEDGKTAWRMRNAFTEAYKQIANPMLLTRRSQVLTGLLDAQCGILNRAPIIDVDGDVQN